MLMNIAQMLSECCCEPRRPDGSADTRYLVLPRLDADPLLQVVPPRRRQVPLLFRDVFDAPAFVRGVRPCRAVDASPHGPGAVDAKTRKPLPANVFGAASASSPLLEHTTPQPIRGKWNQSAHLERVYRAARPSERVQRLIRALEAEAVRLAGPRWDAVHLPIEKDWWWASSFCAPRPREGRVRRCFSPSEVARAIAPARAASGATGSVLLFAHDKVSDFGPPVCAADFGPRAVKLVLPYSSPSRLSREACVAHSSCYTIRNAAEQFLAVRAPAGFFGNSFSTFSKGIALLRAAKGVPSQMAGSAATPPRADANASRGGEVENDWGSASFAYDCASIAPEVIKPVFTAHPGFHLLRQLGAGGQYGRGGVPCPPRSVSA